MLLVNMQGLWFLGICWAAVSVTGLQQNDTRLHGDNGWYVPHLNGSFVWMDKREAETYLKSEESLESFSLLTPVKFYLYTKLNASRGKKITMTSKSIEASNFNSSHPTRFIIHGWVQSYLSSMNKKIRKAWLNLDEYNVIVVDWARARSEYVTSVLAVPAVGKIVANLIDFLTKNYNMQLNTLQVIGHSLGAHVAGYAGKNVQSGQIHAIIGLDPALPLFCYSKPHKRLSATDAFYVETIHTDGGRLGFLKPLGKAAFYPNGGRSQPGCLLDIASVCAHERSVTYYAESITEDDFGAIKCETYKEAVAKHCGPTFSTVRMGAIENAYMAAGAFYVPLNKKPPYGILPKNNSYQSKLVFRTPNRIFFY